MCIYSFLSFTGELEESLRAQFEPLERRRHDGVTVSIFERHTPGDDRWAFWGVAEEGGGDFLCFFFTGLTRDPIKVVVFQFEACFLH